MSRIFLIRTKESSVGRHEIKAGSAVAEGLAKEMVQLQQSLSLQN